MEDLEIILYLSLQDLQKWYILESIIVSIIILLLSYLFLILSLISEFGGGTGWTLYPPLSTSVMTFITFKYRKSYIRIINLWYIFMSYIKDYPIISFLGENILGRKREKISGLRGEGGKGSQQGKGGKRS